MRLWKFKKRIEINKTIGNFHIETFHYGGFDKKGKNKNWTELDFWYECDCEHCPLSWEIIGYDDVDCGCYMAKHGEDCPRALLICMLPKWIKRILLKHKEAKMSAVYKEAKRAIMDSEVYCDYDCKNCTRDICPEEDEENECNECND